MDDAGLKDFLRRAKDQGRSLVSVVDPEGDTILEGSVIGTETAAEVADLIDSYTADLGRRSWHRFRVVAQSEHGVGRIEKTFRVRGRSDDKDAAAGEAPKGREMAAAIASLTACIEKMVARTIERDERSEEREFEYRAALDAADKARREAGDEVAMTRLLLEHEETKWVNRLEMGGMMLDKVRDFLPVLGVKTPAKGPDGKVLAAAAGDVGDGAALDRVRRSIPTEQWQKIAEAFGEDAANKMRHLSPPRALAAELMAWPNSALPILAGIIGPMKLSALSKILAPLMQSIRDEQQRAAAAAPANGAPKPEPEKTS